MTYEKHFPNYKSVRLWFWLVYKFTENNCRLRHFSEFNKIQKMHSTSVDKIIILTWKLLVTSSQIFSCVNQTPKELTTSKICHVSRCGFKVLILNIQFKTKNSESTERRKISFPKEIVKPVLNNTKQPCRKYDFVAPLTSKQLFGMKVSTSLIYKCSFLVLKFRMKYVLEVYHFSLMIKGTLKHIWKSPYMFVFMYKQHRENFAFLNPKNCNVICPWSL